MAGNLLVKHCFLISLVLLLVLAGSGLSGCTGSPPSVTIVQALVSGDTISISGDKTNSAAEQNSTDFNLTAGTYILSYTNENAPDNTFSASLESSDGPGFFPLSFWDRKGSIALIVDGTMTPAGKYHLNVANGGKYAVTITRPGTGAAVPVTIKGAKSEQVARAVSLNPGAVTIKVAHDSGTDGTTFVSLYDLKGNPVISDLADPAQNTSEKTGSVSEAGTYVFAVMFPDNTGGSITVSQ